MCKFYTKFVQYSCTNCIYCTFIHILIHNTSFWAKIWFLYLEETILRPVFWVQLTHLLSHFFTHFLSNNFYSNNTPMYTYIVQKIWKIFGFFGLVEGHFPRSHPPHPSTLFSPSHWVRFPILTLVKLINSHQ